MNVDAREYRGLKTLQVLVPASPLGSERLGTGTRYSVTFPDGWGSWWFGLVLLVISAVCQRGVEMARKAGLAS